MANKTEKDGSNIVYFGIDRQIKKRQFKWGDKNAEGLEKMMESIWDENELVFYPADSQKEWNSRLELASSVGNSSIVFVYVGSVYKRQDMLFLNGIDYSLGQKFSKHKVVLLLLGEPFREYLYKLNKDIKILYYGKYLEGEIKEINFLKYFLTAVS